MLNALRRRVGDEGGFTLIELLVVILIIGILSAIAIPAFLSQTTKASDSAAKTQVGTLQTTIETYAAENNGSYANATLEDLQKNRADAERHVHGNSSRGDRYSRRIHSLIYRKRHERRIHAQKRKRIDHPQLYHRQHYDSG